MHPRQDELLKSATALTEKLALKVERKPGSPMLWKYTDPDGNKFWLEVKRMTVKSPFSGKNFTSKPERETPSGVGKDIREEDKTPAGAGPGGKSTTKRKKADWETSSGEEHESKEHASPEALKQYLQDHPKADKSKHTVKPTKEEKAKQRSESIQFHLDKRNETEALGDKLKEEGEADERRKNRQAAWKA